MLEIKDIQQAYTTIKPYITETPMIRMQNLDRYLGCNVYIKAECMQITNAFKLRGALNKILSLDKNKLKNGIVTASSGNHGRACAYAARQLGISSTIVIPEGAPKIKVENIRKLGAEIVQCPAVERFKIAERICNEKNAVFIHPYDDEYVMAGQGTAGIEIIEQLPDVNTVVVPLSGGGLLSGISTSIKGLSKARVIGTEPENIARYTASIKAGEPVEVEQKVTVADALLSNHPGQKCFPIVTKNTDEVVTVSEYYIKQAQKLLLCEGKIFAEPSACTGIGALLQGNFSVADEEKVCFFVSGGNCAIEQLTMLNDVSFSEV